MTNNSAPSYSATAIATPITGSIVAIFGRRRVLLMCTSGFTLATLACGFATSLESLLFFRILQGLLGAPLVPLSQATLLQSYPREMHAQVNSIYGMSVVIGPAIAPSLGGYLSQAYGWRWVFFLMLPLGILAIIGNMRWVKDAGKVDNVRFDYIGFTLFSVAIVCLQLLLDRGQLIFCSCLSRPFLDISQVSTGTPDIKFSLACYQFGQRGQPTYSNQLLTSFVDVSPSPRQIGCTGCHKTHCYAHGIPM